MDQNNLIKFLSFWIINTLILLVFSAVFANSVVLGNAAMVKSMAAVLSGFVLTISIYLVPPTAGKLDIKLKNDKVIIGGYFIFDAAAVWILKRLADFTGLGISNIFFVLIIAVVLSFAQFAVDKNITKLLKKQVS